MEVTTASPITPAEFLEQYPLYRIWKDAKWERPSTLSLGCAICKKETTWSFDDDLTSASNLYLYRYSCHRCGRSSVYYLVISATQGMIKIGQYPMQSARVPSAIETRLGSSALFYRKALTSRNEGYGLAAVAYFRRVVEDKTNELIDVVADAAEAHSIPTPDVARIRAAKNEKAYEDKLKFAAQAIPTVLKPHGANPLQAMHDILSVGIHTQSEEECLQIADDTREIFDYLFDRLRSEVEDRTTFVTRVKAIVSRRGRSSS